MKIIRCYKCKTEFGMADDIYNIALSRREKFAFYCPNGHDQHFITGESEEEKLRRERDQLKQSIAYEQDRLRAEREAREAAERRVRAARGQITKLKNRASKGVCPCCNRHFTNLERHMHSQHPGFTSEPDATAAIN